MLIFLLEWRIWTLLLPTNHKHTRSCTWQLEICSQLFSDWSCTSYQSRSCWCWWSFWSGQSSCRTPSPPPRRKVSQTGVSLCPSAGRDGGPGAGCGCGGFLSLVTSSPVQRQHLSELRAGLQPPSLTCWFNMQRYFTSGNNKTHLVFLERSHCASRSVFPWWVKKRRKLRWVIFFLWTVCVAASWRGIQTLC